MTRPGWLGGGEVVEVTFDPEAIDFGALLVHAKRNGCTDTVWTRTDEQQRVAAEQVGDTAKRSDDAIRVEDNKYHLSRTALRLVPMTELQAARVNATLGAGELPDKAQRWLSERQLGLLERILAADEAHADWEPPRAVGVELIEAWEQLEAELEGLAALPAGQPEQG